MDIAFKKFLTQILFWVYDFIDTVSSMFQILTGTQAVTENNQSIFEVISESVITTKLLLGLVLVSIIIVGASVGVKVVKNVIKLKQGGETSSHAATLGNGFLAILSSVVCIFFVFMFIAFSTMLLNAVNSALSPTENVTLSQNLFNISVEPSYVIDYDATPMQKTGGLYYDENGNKVQQSDPESDDGLRWLKDEITGEYILDENDKRIPVYRHVTSYVYPYKVDENGNKVTEPGYMQNGKDENGDPVYYTCEDINWDMTMDEVFGVHYKESLFENSAADYTTEPKVRLESFNLFTAYLVAVVMVVSLFMLGVGLVKRLYDMLVLIICMPLVCGTIPLDEGARFRAWRETFMSKVLVAFGAVIAVNLFFIISGWITGSGFLAVETYLKNAGFGVFQIIVLKILLLLGGGLCINGSQTLVARIMGTSADESREAMQSAAVIGSAVKLGGAGVVAAGRMAFGAGRMVFGGTNRYGRQTLGLLGHAARGVNAIGNKIGGEKYANSKGAAFARKLGRMGSPIQPFSSRNGGLSQPGVINNIAKPAGGTSGQQSPAALRRPVTSSGSKRNTSFNGASGGKK